MEQPTPTFGRLVSHDRNFQIALFMALGPIIPFVYSRVMSGDLFSFRLDVQTLFLPVVSILGILWLTYQYNVIMTTFRDGMTVKGNLIRTEHKTTQMQKGRSSTTYYAIVSYTVNNETFERRIKLPGYPERYGLADGMALDLILREEKPKAVFIKKLYLD